MIKCHIPTYTRSDIAWGLAIYIIIVGCVIGAVALIGRVVIHSAILPDENQAQCESLGGRWSVNHQCYNAGEPTTIKKLKESLRSTAR